MRGRQVAKKTDGPRVRPPPSPPPCRGRLRRPASAALAAAAAAAAAAALAVAQPAAVSLRAALASPRSGVRSVERNERDRPSSKHLVTA